MFTVHSYIEEFVIFFSWPTIFPISCVSGPDENKGYPVSNFFYQKLNKHKRYHSIADALLPILLSSLQFLPQTQPGGFVYPPQQQQGGFPQGGGYPPQQVRRSYNVKTLGFHIFLLRRAMLLLSLIHQRNLSLPWPLFNKWEDVERHWFDVSFFTAWLDQPR